MSTSNAKGAARAAPSNLCCPPRLSTVIQRFRASCQALRPVMQTVIVIRITTCRRNQVLSLCILPQSTRDEIGRASRFIPHVGQIGVLLPFRVEHFWPHGVAQFSANPVNFAAEKLTIEVPSLSTQSNEPRDNYDKNGDRQNGPEYRRERIKRDLHSLPPLRSHRRQIGKRDHSQTGFYDRMERHHANEPFQEILNHS